MESMETACVRRSPRKSPTFILHPGRSTSLIRQAMQCRSPFPIPTHPDPEAPTGATLKPSLASHLDRFCSEPGPRDALQANRKRTHGPPAPTAFAPSSLRDDLDMRPFPGYFS